MYAFHENLRLQILQYIESNRLICEKIYRVFRNTKLQNFISLQDYEFFLLSSKLIIDDVYITVRHVIATAAFETVQARHRTYWSTYLSKYPHFHVEGIPISSSLSRFTFHARGYLPQMQNQMRLKLDSLVLLQTVTGLHHRELTKSRLLRRKT